MNPLLVIVVIDDGTSPGDLLTRSLPALLFLLLAAPTAHAQVVVHFATGARAGRTTTSSVRVGPRSSSRASGRHAPPPTTCRAPRPTHQARGYRAPRPARQTSTYRAPRPTHQTSTYRAPRPTHQTSTYRAPRLLLTSGTTAPEPTCRTPGTRSSDRAPRAVIVQPRRTPRRIHFDHPDGTTTVVSRGPDQDTRVTYQTRIEGRTVWISSVPGADMTSPGTGRVLSRDLPPTGRTARLQDPTPASPSPSMLDSVLEGGPLAPRLYAALLGHDLLDACRLASWADDSPKRRQILERALFTQLPSPSVLATAARILRETGWQGLPGRDTLLRVLEGARPQSR